MTEAKKIRIRLFARLSPDLTRNRPEIADRVQCPLCPDLFTADQVEEGLVVTAEHSIPGELGGVPDTLTCQRCNNRHGSSMDSQLIKAIATLNGLEGFGPIIGEQHNEGGHVSVKVKWAPEGSSEPTVIEVLGGKHSSNPAGIKAILETMRTGGDGTELSYTLYPDFVLEKYWRAAMRIGYLALFQHRGYSYVLSEGAAQVRRILDGAAVERTPVLEVHTDLPGRLLSLRADIESGSFWTAMMRLGKDRTQHLAVLLPGENGCDWKTLYDIAASPGGLEVCRTAGATPEKVIRFGPDPVLARIMRGQR